MNDNIFPKVTSTKKLVLKIWDLPLIKKKKEIIKNVMAFNSSQYTLKVLKDIDDLDILLSSIINVTCDTVRAISNGK